MKLKEKAAAFARYVHRNQIRKYSGAPYFVHLEEVATIVAHHGANDNMIAAAYLHDAVEDQEVPIELIELLFNKEIAMMVFDLTDVTFEKGNRATRKNLDRQRLANSTAETQTIKLADTLSNVRSIKVEDPDFAKVFLKEVKLLVDVLQKGNEDLRKQIYDIL